MLLFCIYPRKGVIIPAFFSTDDAEDMGFSDRQGSFLITFIGLGNLLGKFSLKCFVKRTKEMIPKKHVQFSRAKLIKKNI